MLMAWQSRLAEVEGRSVGRAKTFGRRISGVMA
jgi:hypothetical protein